MRTHAERRPTEFEKRPFPMHFLAALRRCRSGSLMTPPDHASITYTPYR
jgi:hypothetical protein